MTASAGAFYYIFPPVGTSAPMAMHDPMLGKLPVIFMGAGSPTEDIEPFVSSAKGSIYIITDAADNTECIWVKVDDANAGDDTDWYGVTISAA